MAETALNFGPDWLRALSHGSTTSSQPSSSIGIPVPKYSLAEFRYGREEMLALIPKDQSAPDCLKEFPHLMREKFQLPLALTPVTEDEQRIWSRSVNSDAVLRASGKTGPGNSLGRSIRGGSVDRGRGRGRGSYYQRGLAYDDSEDGPPPTTSFTRPKPIERSQSANEKDQRWDDRDRRFDRTFSGRGAGIDDSVSKAELSRGSNEYWRKFDKEEDSDWRSSGLRSSDKLGNRNSWRSNTDKERRDNLERNSQNRSSSGNARSASHPHSKTSGSHHPWKEDSQGNLPEWSVEEANEPDLVGTFDSSGAFLETKMAENTSMDEIYASDDADEGTLKGSPEANKDSSKKTQKKSPNSQPVPKQNAAKRNAKTNSDEDTVVDKHIHKNISEPCKNVHKNSTNLSKEPSVDNVIKQCAVVEQHQTIKKMPEYNHPLPNVPDDVAKCTKSDSAILNNARAFETSAPSATMEEDAFAHHKKATENMVAQWTEEEEQRVISRSNEIHPSLHEKDNKWFYQDPQGEIQGPFTSPEMLEWFNAGYFTMGLMVRRGCDEKFSQLGDLIKSWGRVPFLPGKSPPPMRVTPLTSSLPTPMTQTIVPNPVAAPAPAQLPKQDDHLLALQQQLLQQQLMQQQILLRQAQLQQLLAQLNKQDNFTSLNTQQQQQVLMQQFMAQQQMPRPNIGPVTDQSGILESMAPLPLPLLGLPLPTLMKNDLSLWNLAASSGTWPLNLNANQPPTGSIWDVDLSKPNTDDSELEKKKRLAEEQEKIRKAEEERLEQEREMEAKRKLDELRRKQEEERILKELQKQEEEKKRLEELKRQEEEKRRLDELRQLEEQKRKEEELRKQEELRKIEEEKRRIEEQKRLEELRRQEERKRLEELKKKEDERKQEELRKLEEHRKSEEKRKKEEMQKKLQMEKEREKQLELERQKEAAHLKELEREEKLKREREKQREKEELELKKAVEQKMKSQGPAWGIQNSQSNSQLSLVDIQRIQEEKEREEREEKMRQQLLLQQQAVKQVQQNKNGLSWAKRSAECQPAVKSLAEIQQEEAERLAQLQRSQKPQAPPPVMNSNAGVWGNASHLNRITSAPQSWNINNVATSGFWDDALSSTQTRKQPSKTNDSAFPALSNPVQPAIVNSNKNKHVRAKKEEDLVTRLFGTHRKPTDEFTVWCTEAISSMPSSVDVPTFVAFLKDIESPYEVYDYVKSYFGEGKEPREFAKQFLERRSKYRNQAKQTPAEENTLWGPAPAITPAVNKSNVQNSNDNDGNSNTKGKTKKRKNRMQKLDNSMLGFTVQSNPDRLNVGEIDHVEGM